MNYIILISEMIPSYPIIWKNALKSPTWKVRPFLGGFTIHKPSHDVATFSPEPVSWWFPTFPDAPWKFCQHLPKANQRNMWSKKLKKHIPYMQHMVGTTNVAAGWNNSDLWMIFPSYKHRYHPLSSWISRASCNSWSCWFSRRVACSSLTWGAKTGKLGWRELAREAQKLENSMIVIYHLSLFQSCSSRICAFLSVWGFLGKCLVEWGQRPIGNGMTSVCVVWGTYPPSSSMVLKLRC